MKFLYHPDIDFAFLVSANSLIWLSAIDVVPLISDVVKLTFQILIGTLTVIYLIVKIRKTKKESNYEPQENRTK